MKKKIIYIIGSGRSGTTLLDILLGNEEGIFSGGELTRYARRGGIPTGFEDKPERTLFWKRFTEHFAKDWDLNQIESLVNNFEYYYQKNRKNILNSKKNASNKATYYQFLNSFFQHIFEHIDENIIVDSSKYPKRARNLSACLKDYQIDYIYIKRNPIGVVKSFAKTDVYIPPKNWLSANIYYFITNILCAITLKKLKKKHKVVSIRYEDLISSPEAVLDQIGQAFSIDFSLLKEKLRKNDPLIIGDLFEGNSMRIKKSIKLQRTLPAYQPSMINAFTRVFNLLIYR